MARVQCPNPQCRKVYPYPDEHLGRKVRCKACSTLFTATAVPGGTSTGDGDVITVVARRVGMTAAPPRSRASMLNQATMLGPNVTPVPAAPAAPPAPPPSPLGRYVLAFLLLVIPIAAAGGFVAYKGFGGGGGAGGSSGEGSLHAGIEIGSSGVKLVVLEVFPDAEYGYGVEFVAEPKTDNTNLVAGLDRDNRFDPETVRDTARVVAGFCEEAVKKHNVPKDHVYVVGGSGLFSSLHKKKDLAPAQREKAVAENRATLAEAVKSAAGRPLQFLEAAEEATLLFRGAVPRPYANTSVMYDVGSGNTKAAYSQGSGRIVTAELPYGTKSYHKQVKDDAERTNSSFAAQLSRSARPFLQTPLKEQIQRKPGLANQPRVYLAGGICWMMANYVHPDNRRAFVEVSADDVRAFARLLPKGHPAIAVECKAKVTDDKARADLEKDLNEFPKIYDQDQMTAGSEILRTLSDEVGFRGKKVYFARFAIYAWILAYVGEKSNAAAQ